jgi:hypothetical protein
MIAGVFRTVPGLLVSIRPIDSWVVFRRWATVLASVGAVVTPRARRWAFAVPAAKLGFFRLVGYRHGEVDDLGESCVRVIEVAVMDGVPVVS